MYANLMLEPMVAIAGTARSPRVREMSEPMEDLRARQIRQESKAEADHDLLVELSTTLKFIVNRLNEFQASTTTQVTALSLQLSAQVKAVEVAMEARLAVITVDVKAHEHATEAKLVPIRLELAGIQRFRWMLAGGCIAMGAAGSALFKLFWH